MSEEPIKRGRGRPRKPKPDTIPPKGKAGRPKSPIAAARAMSGREYAMTHLFDAIDVWARIMKDEDAPHAAQVAAAAHVVNRAIGQPTQSIEMTGRDGAPMEVARIERVVVDPAVMADAERKVTLQ